MKYLHKRLTESRLSNWFEHAEKVYLETMTVTQHSLYSSKKCLNKMDYTC